MKECEHGMAQDMPCWQCEDEGVERPCPEPDCSLLKGHRGDHDYQRPE